MAKHRLVYWLPDTVDRELQRDGAFNHAASEQFDRVEAGDTLWMVTVRSGKLRLVGRLIVGTRTDRRESERILGTTNLWDAEHHVIARSDTAQMLREVNLADVADQIRFESATSDRLTSVDGTVSPQQLQTMRTLTPQGRPPTAAER